MSDLTPGLFLGIDIGTSGVRACAVRGGAIVAETAVARHDSALGEGADAEDWWRGVEACLDAMGERIDMGSVAALAVDGTSGSMVLVDDEVRPLTPGLLYNSSGFEAEAERIAAHAPENSIARGLSSALARLLRLQSLTDEPGHLCHQADFIVARLRGRTGASDESNALKTGYDAEGRRWPDWLKHVGVTAVLPEVHPVGAAIGTVSKAVRERFGFRDARIVTGATDSTAAFLAAGVTETGTAVTSLGTTLALKVLADRPVTDLSRGVYSHRVGDRWLPGGASNTGGGVLLQHFSRDEIASLSDEIDPDWQTRFPDAYPLTKRGERFPRNDATLEPRLPERTDDARFLFELLHAMARIEKEGYDALHSLGAPYPTRVVTAGGGAKNAVWTVIRSRVLGVPVEPASNADAAYGMALTASRASTD